MFAVPAPGFRDSGWNGQNGSLMNVGNNGYSWSSAVEGIRGLFLNFNTQNLNPSNPDNRAFGLQVRCLQAFIDPMPRLFSVRFDGNLFVSKRYAAYRSFHPHPREGSASK